MLPLLAECIAVALHLSRDTTQDVLRISGITKYLDLDENRHKPMSYTREISSLVGHPSGVIQAVVQRRFETS